MYANKDEVIPAGKVYEYVFYFIYYMFLVSCIKQFSTDCLEYECFFFKFFFNEIDEISLFATRDVGLGGRVLWPGQGRGPSAVDSTG